VSRLNVQSLAGNVAEWIDDPLFCKGENGAIIGGSAWSADPMQEASVFAAPRPQNADDRRDVSVGFRCAYELPAFDPLALDGERNGR
jgi:formylglycine-generating enzyme required for sulfatase activity